MGLKQSKGLEHGRSNVQTNNYDSESSQIKHEQTRATQRIQTKYVRIGDDYNTLEQVTEALANAGLESSNLIVGIDFTKSNEWTGQLSFGGRSLHDMNHSPNPYEQAISIIGRTLATFDEDNLIPCYGFGDSTTHDREVFNFYPDNRPCNGFDEALKRYREIVPNLLLSGPTSFGPIIETAISIVDKSRGQYHVLLIIADGQVTESTNRHLGQLSPQERDTINAIVKASEYPLSIVVVGVGDGPWDMMKKFDDSIPSRAFDNFQFVNFTEIMSRKVPTTKKEADFALAALMEIPSQYQATINLRILGNFRGIPEKISRPPPPTLRSRSSADMISAMQLKDSSIQSNKFAAERHLCLICSSRTNNLAFQCGHQTCDKCGKDLHVCPVCRNPINKRIKLN